MARIKICGVKRLRDAELADSIGADYVGYIVDPKLARGVDVDTALRIHEVLSRATPVTVIVGNFGIDALEHRLVDIAKIIQIHKAPINDGYVELISRLIDLGLRVIPVYIDDRLNKASLNNIKNIQNTYSRHIEAVLIDAPKNTGKKYDLGLKLSIETYKEFCSNIRPCGVAGGINDRNIHLFKEIKPDVIDVSSGIEIEIGVKDPNKMRRIIEVGKYI